MRAEMIAQRSAAAVVVVVVVAVVGWEASDCATVEASER
jgi:hypothetical protein